MTFCCLLRSDFEALCEIVSQLLCHATNMVPFVLLCLSNFSAKDTDVPRPHLCLERAVRIDQLPHVMHLSRCTIDVLWLTQL